MLNALTNVRFWGQSGPVTTRCLPISISQYTAKLALKTEKEKDAKAGVEGARLNMFVTMLIINMDVNRDTERSSERVVTTSVPREGKNRKRRWRPKKRERQ